MRLKPAICRLQIQQTELSWPQVVKPWLNGLIHRHVLVTLGPPNYFTGLRVYKATEQTIIITRLNRTIIKEAHSQNYRTLCNYPEVLFGKILGKHMTFFQDSMT